MIGGGLAEPAKTMPRFFQGTMFETFPYLLPSLVTAVLPGVTALAALIWLPEVKFSLPLGPKSKLTSRL